MTEHYLRNAVADAISGAVSACEGIKNSLVLLNGPMGCKTYYSFSGVDSVIREQNLWGMHGDIRLSNAMDDRLIRSQFCIGSTKTPATNLMHEDYIFGTRGQLRRALNDFFSERTYDLFTVIQTPGTSLIGEALENELQEISQEFGVPYLFVESTSLSENSLIGYDICTTRLLKLLAVKKEKSVHPRPVVNLFGFDSTEKYPEGGVNEIRRLLSLCGIDVAAVAGMNCAMEDFINIPNVDAQIVLCPERCKHTAEYLKTAFDVPVYETGGMPIGFDLTEKFVREICALLHTDPGAALRDIEEHRARAFYFIAKCMGQNGFPRDLRYAAEGEGSVLLGYMDFLSGYLGIKPKAVHMLYAECGGEDAVIEKLKAYQSEKAWTADITKVNDVLLLASANTIVELNTYSDNIFGIETANPSSGYIHVVPKTHIGCAGALYLLEQVINGTKLLRAWN